MFKFRSLLRDNQCNAMDEWRRARHVRSSRECQSAISQSDENPSLLFWPATHVTYSYELTTVTRFGERTAIWDKSIKKLWREQTNKFPGEYPEESWLKEWGRVVLVNEEKGNESSDSEGIKRPSHFPGEWWSVASELWALVSGKRTLKLLPPPIELWFASIRPPGGPTITTTTEHQVMPVMRLKTLSQYSDQLIFFFFCSAFISLELFSPAPNLIIVIHWDWIMMELDIMR